MNKAFGMELRDYQAPGEAKYRSHNCPICLPKSLTDVVEAVVGFTDRQMPAKHFLTARRRHAGDTPNTQPLTPQTVASLYRFPAGTGAGQTIGIFEITMQ